MTSYITKTPWPLVANPVYDKSLAHGTRRSGLPQSGYAAGCLPPISGCVAGPATIFCAIEELPWYFRTIKVLFLSFYS